MGPSSANAGKSSAKSSWKRKKPYRKVRGKQYVLRSAGDGARVLRSMSKEKPTTPAEPASAITTETRKRQKRQKRKFLKISSDEFTRNRKRVRYLLTRMGFEQNLIDAYSGEGWRGQSLEKLRPEKELERAKLEILRCKLKIRDLFHAMDSSLSDGKLQEDPKGEINSEDIFCAKCGSKDLPAGNDIVLCDGLCDRGFHQNCLNPPLLTEDIPPGDESWLCPACDCRIDCIDFINEFQDSDLSVSDTWEKIFPEADAIANGGGQYDALDFPSDDSEDDEYNPDAPEVDIENQDEVSSSGGSDSSFSAEDSDSSASGDYKNGKTLDYKNGETLGLPSDDSEDDDYNPDGPDPDEIVQKYGSSSDESHFTSDSDDFMDEINNTSDANQPSTSHLLDQQPSDYKNGKTLGLPSDDSEDDDYNPDDPDPDERVQKDGLSSDESHFTSDSDDFMDEINNTSDANQPSTSQLLDQQPSDHSGEGILMKDRNTSSINPELASISEPDMNDLTDLPVEGKRHVERLDYKKLYEETYGDISSASSDDDDWCNMSTPKKLKKEDTANGSTLLPKANTTTTTANGSILLPNRNAETTATQRTSKRPVGKRREANTVEKAELVEQQVLKVVTENISERLQQKLDSVATDHSISAQHSSLEFGSNGKKSSTSAHKVLSKMTSQKLLESFDINQYPNRETKESLAKELGVTFKQVNTWFGNARHRTLVAGKASQQGLPRPELTESGSNVDTDKVAAESTTFRAKAEDGDKGAEGSSTPNLTKGKDSGRTRKRKGRAEHDIDGEDEKADGKRRKAITRELRKRGK